MELPVSWKQSDHSPLTSDLKKSFSLREHSLTGYFLFLREKNAYGLQFGTSIHDAAHAINEILELMSSRTGVPNEMAS